MPGLVPGIHVSSSICEKDVDGRDKRGHDEKTQCHVFICAVGVEREIASSSSFMSASMSAKSGVLK